MFFPFLFAIFGFLAKETHAGTALISRIFGLRDELCPDRDIYEQCVASCRITYLDCLTACDSSICHSNCLGEFSACDNSCPCGGSCIAGCVDCEEHPLCQEKCLNAEQDNAEYKACLNDSLDQMTSCMKSCVPTEECHERCCFAHKERMTSCPCFQSQGTSTTMATTTTASTRGEHILVMGASLSTAFSISFDGSTKTEKTITAPSDNYLYRAPHALVKGEVYVFGGESDRQRIAKLEGCRWVEQSTRTVNQFFSVSAALAIENGDKALICIDYSERKKCEIFDTTTSVSTYSTVYQHTGGKLGYYKGQPTTVGHTSGSDDANKVETLSSSGWLRLADFPSKIAYHFLMGLPSGSLLLAGGRKYENGYILQTAIWLLKNDNWNKIGDLQNADWYGSAIMINNSIFVVSGWESPYAIERLDFEGDELVNQEVIGNSFRSEIPVLFEVPADYCV